jgi:hypothetical protein
MVEGIYYYEHEVKMTEHWSLGVLDGECVLNIDVSLKEYSRLRPMLLIPCATLANACTFAIMDPCDVDFV